MAADEEAPVVPHQSTHPPDTDSADLEQRLDRLEATVGALVEQLSSGCIAPPAAGPSRFPEAAPPAAPATAETATPAGPSPEAPPALPDDFWALNALKQRIPEPGGVVYAGAVDLPVGHIEYQWGRPTDPLLRADWAERAERIAALGHPLRLSILRMLLDGERSVAQLVDDLDLASTGVAYHHLNQLQNVGWATSPRRGVWEVPASRIVPLLAIITAVENA